MNLSAKIIFFIETFLCCLTFSATLILDEQFTESTSSYYQGRGWYDGTSQITVNNNCDGYKFETDSILRRNVMYVHWDTLTPSTKDVKGPADAWRYPLSNMQTTNGATMYILAKFHNVMGGSALGGHWVRFGRGFDKFTAGNSAGQMDLDIATISQGDVDYNPATKLKVDPVQRTLHYYAGGDSSGRDIGWAGAINVLTDDEWYEIACYMLPGNAGAVNCIARKYKTTTWTTIFKGNNIITSTGSGNITQFLIGPYMDRWTSDIRHYFATIRIYAGDAISDGTLDGIKSVFTLSPSVICYRTIPKGTFRVFDVKGRVVGLYSRLGNEEKSNTILPNGQYFLVSNIGVNNCIKTFLTLH